MSKDIVGIKVPALPLRSLTEVTSRCSTCTVARKRALAEGQEQFTVCTACARRAFRLASVTLLVTS